MFRKMITISLLLFVVSCLVFSVGCEKKQDGGGVNGESVDKKVVDEKPAEATKPKEVVEPVATAPLRVKFETTMGDIVVELNEKAAPITVKNFLRYVDEGYYGGTIFHRVIKGFMVQGGGLTANMAKKPTHETIRNEASNGLKNVRGSISMARMNPPHTASSQFFINHVNNYGLDYVAGRNHGYAVFGKTVEGMDIVDKIAVVPVTTRAGMPNVPVEPVIIKSAKVISGR